MTGRELKPHDRTVDVTIRRIRKHFESTPDTRKSSLPFTVKATVSVAICRNNTIYSAAMMRKRRPWGAVFRRHSFQRRSLSPSAAGVGGTVPFGSDNAYQSTRRVKKTSGRSAPAPAPRYPAAARYPQNATETTSRHPAAVARRQTAGCYAIL